MGRKESNQTKQNIARVESSVTSKIKLLVELNNKNKLKVVISHKQVRGSQKWEFALLAPKARRCTRLLPFHRFCDVTFGPLDKWRDIPRQNAATVPSYFDI